MTYDDIKPGSVIEYPYPWRREEQAGETEGRKRRETAVVARFLHQETDYIFLLAVTATPPREGQVAFELPETEVFKIARGGASRLWVMPDEMNYDIVGRSYYLEPNANIADLSPRTFAALAAVFRKNFTAMAKVKRAD